MSRILILMKGKKFQHTYSGNVANTLEKDGWKLIASVYGLNVSISFFDIENICDGCHEPKFLKIHTNGKKYCKRCLEEVDVLLNDNE